MRALYLLTYEGQKEKLYFTAGHTHAAQKLANNEHARTGRRHYTYRVPDDTRDTLRLSPFGYCYVSTPDGWRRIEFFIEEPES